MYVVQFVSSIKILPYNLVWWSRFRVRVDHGLSLGPIRIILKTLQMFPTASRLGT